MRCSTLLSFLCLVASPMVPALQAQTLSFAPTKQIAVGDSTVKLASIQAAGNFNGDGKISLLVSAYDANYVATSKFLSGDGNGGFTVQSGPNISGNVVADVNGDGKDDLILTQGGCGDGSEACATGDFAVMLSQGNGRFTPGFTTGMPTGQTSSAIAGDFNKDGKPDIAVLLIPQPSGGSTGLLVVYLNQGKGTFTSKSYNLPFLMETELYITNLVAGDFTGDGNTDLAFAFNNSEDNYGQQGLYTLAGDGKGGFGPAQYKYAFDSPIIGGGTNGLAASDLNGDGLADLVANINGARPASPDALPTTNRIPTLLASPAGGFYWSAAVATPRAATTDGGSEILLTDLNGDKKPDLISFAYGVNSTGQFNMTGGVYLGLGNGEYQTPHIPLNFPGTPQNPVIRAFPLKTGALPSLFVSGADSTLKLLVNTTVSK